MVSNKSVPAQESGKAVEKKRDWTGVDSWDAAVAAFQGNIQDSVNTFGDGVKLVEKKELIDREFILLECRPVYNKKTGELDYLNFLCIARNGNKFCFNDGSTGCMRQAQEIEERTGELPEGIYCQRGLRSSTYEVEVDGKLQEATTYYFA
jgi:hypothetical protein